MTGWDLAQAVDSSIGQFWNVTRSQIYRELKTLDEAALVVVGETGPRERRPYSITETGRAAFAFWIKREPGPELIRFPLLLTLFFGDHLDEHLLDRFLRIHRLRHEQRLEYYRALVADLRGHSQAERTLRFGILYEEAVISWFDSLPSPSTGAQRPARSSSYGALGKQPKAGASPKVKRNSPRRP